MPFGVMAQSMNQDTQSEVTHSNGGMEVLNGSNGGMGVPLGNLNGSMAANDGLPDNKPNNLAQNLQSNEVMEVPIGPRGDNTSFAMPKNVDLTEEKPNSFIETSHSPSTQLLPPELIKAGQTQRWQGKYPDLNPVSPLIQPSIENNVLATNHADKKSYD